MTTQMAELIRVSKGSVAISGEPLAYPNSPDPEMTASIMPIPPGGKTEWMTHPVPAYALHSGRRADRRICRRLGPCQKFKAGEGFIQARSAWHRGRNDGQTEMRFLAVFSGAKEVPNVLHPPKGAAINSEFGKTLTSSAHKQAVPLSAAPRAEFNDDIRKQVVCVTGRTEPHGYRYIRPASDFHEQIEGACVRLFERSTSREHPT